MRLRPLYGNKSDVPHPFNSENSLDSRLTSDWRKMFSKDDWWTLIDGLDVFRLTIGVERAVVNKLRERPRKRS